MHHLHLRRLRPHTLSPLLLLLVLSRCSSGSSPPPPCPALFNHCYTFTSPEIPPGEEWQGYQAFPLGNTEGLAVVEVKIVQEGLPSHHFIFGQWVVEDGTTPPTPDVYPLESLEGLLFAANTRTILGSVFRTVEFRTGGYVGIEIPPQSWVVLNGHYINTGGKAGRGETQVYLHTVGEKDLPFLARARLPGTVKIFVPPGAVSYAEESYLPPRDQAVLLMTSHMHRHGIRFEVYHISPTVPEGTLIYENEEWDHPPLLIFSGSPNPDPLVLRAGKDSLKFRCTYRNDDLDRPITYGPSANTDEMCIMPIYVVDNPDELLSTLAGKNLEGIYWRVEPY